MKKMYILALTFFTVLCGQVGYGQDVGRAESYNDFLNSIGLPNFEDINDGYTWNLGWLDEVAIYKYKKFDWSANDPWATYNFGNDYYYYGNEGSGTTGGSGGGSPSFENGGPCYITECTSAGRILDETICQCVVDPCTINKDLSNKIISGDAKNLIDQRKQTIFMNGSYVDVNEFEIQEIKDGWGDINLDKYSLNITQFPNGYTPQMLFEEIRTHFSDFLTGGNIIGTSVELEPYSVADGIKWNSGSPIGAAMDFDNLMDTSTVVCTEYNYNEMYWTFTTVRSLDHQGHFVSGHRQFGIEVESNGSYSFYLRGADRLGQWIDYAANNLTPGIDDFLFNEAADATWKNLMTNLEKFITNKNGASVRPFDRNKEDYAKRYDYNEADCPD